MDTLNILLDIQQMEYLGQLVNKRLADNAELLPLVEFCWLFGDINVYPHEIEGFIYKFQTSKLN